MPYHFRINRSDHKKLAIALSINSLAVLLFLATLLATGGYGAGKLAFLFTFLLSLSLLFLIVSTKNRLGIDEQGIQAYGTLRYRMPPRISWEQIEQIYSVRIRFGVAQCENLFIKPRHGAGFFLRERCDGVEHYVCSDASATLRQIIAQYHAIVPLADETLLYRVEAPIGELDRPAKRIACLIMIVLLLALTGFFAAPVYVFGTALPYGISASAILGLLGALFGLKNTWKSLRFYVLTAAFACSSAFAGLTLSGALPYWFGSESRDAFSIVINDDDHQVWRNLAGDTLTLHTVQKKRRYNELGFSKWFTVYRLGGLRAIHGDAYQNLRVD